MALLKDIWSCGGPSILVGAVAGVTTFCLIGPSINTLEGWVALSIASTIVALVYFGSAWMLFPW